MVDTRPIVWKTTLNSATNIVGTDRSHMKANFPTVRIAPGRHDMDIRATIPMVVPRIITGTNDTMRYSVDTGTNWKTVTFDQGTYPTLADLNTALETQLITNGDSVTVSTVVEAAFALIENEPAGKAYIIFNTDFKGSDEYKSLVVDLTNNSTSTLYQMLGFTAAASATIAGTVLALNATGFLDMYHPIINFEFPGSVSENWGGTPECIAHTDAMDGAWQTLKQYGYTYPIKSSWIASDFSSFEVKLTDANRNLLYFPDDTEGGRIFVTVIVY